MKRCTGVVVARRGDHRLDALDDREPRQLVLEPASDRGDLSLAHYRRAFFTVALRIGDLRDGPAEHLGPFHRVALALRPHGPLRLKRLALSLKPGLHLPHLCLSAERLELDHVVSDLPLRLDHLEVNGELLPLEFLVALGPLLGRSELGADELTAAVEPLRLHRPALFLVLGKPVADRRGGRGRAPLRKGAGEQLLLLALALLCLALALRRGRLRLARPLLRLLL